MRVSFGHWVPLLGGIVLLLAAIFAVSGGSVDVSAAPGAAPTSIVDDQSPNNMAAVVLVGQVATPGAAGTPGVYIPLAANSSGQLSASVGSGAVQPIQPNGAVSAQTPVAVAMAGQMVAARSTVVLPAQTPVAYSVGDVVTSSTPVALTFANACRVAGGSGFIVAADLATDQSSNVASYRLWIFQSAPPTPVLDNAANTMLYSNNAIRVGYIDIPALFTNAGSNTAAYGLVPDTRLAYTCAGGSTSLSGILQAQTAFTPASAQGFDAGLKMIPN